MSMTLTLYKQDLASLELCAWTCFCLRFLSCLCTELAGSTCCAWTWSTLILYMLNNISCVHNELLCWNGTVWGEHPQNCVHSVMKRVETPQLAPAELYCIIFTQDCFDGRCTRNISRDMNMHVSVFANTWIYHGYKSSCIMYILWGWKCSPTQRKFLSQL